MSTLNAPVGATPAPAAAPAAPAAAQVTNSAAAATAPAAAPAAPADASTEAPELNEDGTPKKKRGRQPRVPFRTEDAPLIVGPPTGYSAKLHLPLKKTDFESEADYHDWNADNYEKRAKRERKKAEEARMFGNAEQRKAAKRLTAIQERMEKMYAEMREELGEEAFNEVMSRLGGDTSAD